ncbi:MAG: putative DNA binding domain-containing protein [Caldilinea sp.]|nr:putative DNA binding domain-containing protein [Caldilinea sp.]
MSRKKKPNIGTPSASQSAKPQRRWYKVDLHLHTPASHDYEEPGVSYLDWLRKVVEQGLEIVAITDHNTVAGISAIRKELDWLTQLEAQGRLTAQERERLQAWREAGNQVVVLPGFEFTATFGFHILAIFPPETSVRELEHILLSMKVPASKLDIGSTETGATTDVLTAYRIIHEAGGLVIAAHANSTHGVAMRNFPFGGQTKIAYTQDLNLDALEVTDLDRPGRSTARFFNGSKSEYPRRMHCLQGSDAHRLTMDPRNPKRLGIGDRATELLLDEPTFDAIAALLRSKQFDRVRPARPADKPFDPLDVVRDEGPTLVQSFHESAVQRGGKFDAILADICAFANTAGGVVYIGAKPGKGKLRGLTAPGQIEHDIRKAVDERVTPRLEVKIDTVQSGSAKVLRVQVAKGLDIPYALDDNKFYVRDEAETSLAVRDEIVALVREALGFEPEPEEVVAPTKEAPSAPNGKKQTVKPSSKQARPPQNASRNGDASKQGAVTGQTALKPVTAGDSPTLPADDTTFYLPQVGVEIVDSEERNGHRFYTIRDLRNGHVIKNVTRKGARKLWSYAIQQAEDKPIDAAKIQWRNNVGFVRMERRAGKARYDLALREGDKIRIFYGVTDDGMDGAWAQFVQEE